MKALTPLDLPLSKAIAFVILVCTSIQGSFGMELTLIDTKLCSQKLSAEQKKALQDVEAQDCQEQTSSSSKKYHANQVLDVLFTHLSQPQKKQKLKVTHRNIFDSQGKHSLDLWEKVIQELKSRPAQLVVLAVGSPKESLKKLKLPTKHFYLMATGQSNNHFSESAVLWPQKLLIEKDVKGVLIGAYTGTLGETSPEQAPAYAPKLLHRDSIDYLFAHKSLNSELSGSSHALSAAAASLIKKCGQRAIEMWRECLKKNQKQISLLRDLKALTF